MRLKITGEKSLIDALQAKIEEDDDIQFDGIEEAKDETELKFGVAEVLTIIAIVKGVADLTKLILSLRKELGNTKQKIVVQNALGKQEIELSKDITVEELRTKLDEIMS